MLLLIKLTSLHRFLFDFYYYVLDRMLNFTTNVKVRLSECCRYQRNSIASVQLTTADQKQFHEMYASPSVQPIGREDLSKNIRPPADEICDWRTKGQWHLCQSALEDYLFHVRAQVELDNAPRNAPREFRSTLH